MEHNEYPHWPGYLYDCAACESKCHCTPGMSQCVWSDHEETIYTVYTLTDGLVEDVYDGDSYDDAYAMYEGAIGAELARKDADDAYAETTVHLYERATGNMLAEYCITGRAAGGAL